MGLLKEAVYAFRGRRFVEWLFMDRPQIPILSGFAFYTLLYFQYKYDLVARCRGQPTYNDYSYVKQAAERERARIDALSSSPIHDDPSSQTSIKTITSSSTGAA